ncbi:GrdX family protein [Synergistaceae bacterium OttesenSCG-928-I11]|nr:GrdX family protein [Synergistaceae bacterium OttesenSCG-928-I11]
MPPENLVVLTNNRRVAEKCEREEGAPSVVLVDGDPLDVLARALVLLQEHHRLISAPLPPNIPIMRAPFRSLLLETSAAKYDVAGIEAIERARKTMAKQRAIAATEAGGEKDDDFARIDETYLERAMRDYALIAESSK